MIIHDVTQGTPEWYALRAGIPTASEFSKIVTSKGEASKSIAPYARTLAAEKYLDKPVETFEGTKWTERGKELEPQAIAYYEFTTGRTTTQVGFVTDDKKTMGCSPDRFVDGDGVLEIKCLKADHHVEAVMYFQKNNHCQPDYIQQTQGQMMICGRKWSDLLFFYPGMPPLILRQTPIAEVVAGLKTHIPTLLNARDEAIAALRRQAGIGQKAA